MMSFLNLTRKNISIVVYIVIFFLFLIDFSILNNYLGDNFFNYGFVYNIASGMIPYLDFNMVLFPFSSLVVGLIMKILGIKLIIFYMINSLTAALMLYIIKKMDKSVVIIILYIMLLFPIGGYNYLSLLLFFLIIYLEKNNKNDFLIGLILGMIIMTNQKLVLLLLPTFLIKNHKKILARIKGFIIPIQIILMYLFVNNALYYFLDYTIFGLFDFGSKNYNFNIYFLLELIIIFYLLYRYLKSKDKVFLYGCCFQIMATPLFDLYHTTLGLIPFIFCTCHSEGRILKFINLFISFLIIILFSTKLVNIINDNNIYFNTNSRTNFYLTVGYKSIDITDEILTKYYYANISNNTIYFNFSDMYYYKLKNDIPINKFDLIAYGNNGYNGNEKLKEEIKNMENILFIVYKIEDENIMFDQTNYEIIDFITSNYEEIAYLGRDFYVYRIDN